MAGEISKAIGERGEEVAKKIFQEILGYENILTGLNIDCFKGLEHKLSSSKSERTSHGIDGLIGDMSELSNRTLDIGYISVKKTEKVGYKKSDLSKHIRDIVYGLECFKKSKTLSDFKKKYSNVKDAEIVGILIWFSDLDDNYQSVEEYLNEFNIPATLYFENLIILDNKKISFFINTILQDKNIFGKENVSFVYHNSGLNPSIQQYYGKKIPLYYLYSDIIVLRINHNNEIILKFYYTGEFEKDILCGMIDLAIDYDKLDSINRIIFSFKNYIKSQNDMIVNETLIQYQPYFNIEKVEINGHIQTLKNL